LAPASSNQSKSVSPKIPRTIFSLAVGSILIS
jgi:hypothetical protein